MALKAAWKDFERAVARAFRGKRNPASSGKGGVDIYHPEFAIECKYAQKIAIYSWFDQALKYAKGSGKTPLLAMRKAGAGALVALKMEDFTAIIEERDRLKGAQCYEVKGHIWIPGDLARQSTDMPLCLLDGPYRPAWIWALPPKLHNPKCRACQAVFFGDAILRADYPDQALEAIQKPTPKGPKTLDSFGVEHVKFDFDGGKPNV